MDRKERIAAYISSSVYVPLKYNELTTVLDVPKSGLDEFSGILDELIKEGRIYKTKKGRFCPVSAKALTVSGILRCNANGGFGFVLDESGGRNDIFIAHEKMNGAYDRDRVLVRIDRTDNEFGHSEGHIEQIIERGNQTIVGVITGKKNGMYRLSSDRREFFAHVRIDEKDLNGAAVGDRAAVAVKGYNSKGKPVGIVTAVLGSGDSVLSCLNGLASEHNIPSQFLKPVLDEAETLPHTVSERELAGREDFRSGLIFTIDGDDSRDFDDAVSLEEKADGRMLLGVHIADVTHYVADGSELDREALRRATSVYFPHKVIPMLPKRLSNGICSLNPDEDRLTLSVIMEIDAEGNIHSHRIVKSVIHSVARMTYNNVNKILDSDTRLREKYKTIVPVLEKMNVLAKAMADKRRSRGAIDFDFPETKVVCDNEANPVEVKIEERGSSQRLIESFMLAANETIAETAFWAELPFIYRVHEAPSNEKLASFNDFIKNFGYSLRGRADSESVHPSDLQAIIEKVKGSPEEPMISKVLLQSLMKACYRDTNDGHFGLAARYYCHFTSPIRRYPDLMIHRILKEFIDGKMDDSRHSYYEPQVAEAARISSEREITAEKAERDTVDLLKAAYMRKFLGDSFDAVITSVTSFGMFATLSNTCEGLIRCENMTADYFEYDEKRRVLSGQRTGTEYKIGDCVRVTIAAVNIAMRRIDFVLEADNRPDIIERLEKRARKSDTFSHDRKQKKKYKYKRKHR